MTLTAAMHYVAADTYNNLPSDLKPFFVTCPLPLPTRNQDQCAGHQLHLEGAESPIIHCQVCMRKWCFSCREMWHSEYNCEGEKLVEDEEDMRPVARQGDSARALLEVRGLRI